MEAFTSGRVSAAARRCYVETNPTMADAFERTSDGYVMRAWQSQIDRARAMGRGDASGRGRQPHRFDVV